MKFSETVKKSISAALVLLLLLAAGASALAEPGGASEGRTVRMGFFEFGGMFEGAEDGAQKSGYCYEYMMQVATYTGWNYEFCYGTYAELYEKLRSGEIDILPYTNYNEQRGQEVLFSQKALAEEEYYVAVRSGADTDPAALNGAVISTLQGADYNGLLFDWLGENGLGPAVRYYPDLAGTWNAVMNGEADATVFTSNAYDNEGWSFVCSFGRKPTYIAVAKDAPELLEELNEAIDLIDIDNPALMGELYDAYFSDNPMRRSLSAKEQQWLSAHPVIHVGGFVNDAPYLYSVDNGTRTATGLTVDVIDGIIERLGLDITADYRGYASLQEMEAALASGEIDVIMPFYPDFYVAQEHGLVISNNVRTSNMELVYMKGTGYQEALKRIATPVTKLGVFYVQDTFPESAIVGAVSIQDAVDKVHGGEATGAIAQNVVLHNIKEKYDDLNFDVLSDGCGTCFAAATANYPLIRILNRGLNYFTGAEISAIASQYTLEPNVTTAAYLATHREAVILLAVIFTVLVLLAVALVQVNRLKKRADAANRSKTQFLFNMSHDIRTPMNAIIGFTGMAERNVGNREKVLDCLGKIQQSGNMLLSLINNVLEVSRIESDKATLEEQPGDIFLSFAGIESSMREMAESKDIDISFGYGEIADRYVYADFGRCMRVLLNVISNAVKYTKEGGRVKVFCEQTGKAVNGRATYRYTVSDNGIGMSEEFQKHIFEQFARENSATVSGIQGSGLGMSVVKSFVELMHGTVGVESRQGEGTTFTIELPFRLQEGEAYTDPVTGEVVSPDGVTEAAEQIDFNGRKALLVEDNEMNREIAVELLEEAGIAAEEATDGSDAVRILKEKGPLYYDFILMDIQMPVMDGYEATRAIREMYPDVHIPIIALSANAFAEDKAASKAAGMDDHVAKPINVRELITALARFL